jgi:hypothetical protein
MVESKEPIYDEDKNQIEEKQERKLMNMKQQIKFFDLIKA